MLQGGMVSALLTGWLVIVGLGMLLGVGTWWKRRALRVG
jgi:hypothetical protein